jgi:hypothetical protein
MEPPAGNNGGPTGGARLARDLKQLEGKNGFHVRQRSSPLATHRRLLHIQHQSCSNERWVCGAHCRPEAMSALFNFSSFVVVLLLTICTCTYVKGKGKHIASSRSHFWALRLS